MASDTVKGKLKSILLAIIGVKQGEPLSPLFFLFFINNLYKNPQLHNIEAVSNADFQNSYD